MRVAIIGASSDRSKYGNKSLRAHLRRGHEVIPVNPNESTVEGLKAYASIRDVPGDLDRVSMYVPPAIGATLMADIAGRGNIKEVWLNPGAESEEVIAAARAVGIEPILGCSIIDIGERP
ncbi:MAG: hypothetical protein AMXMBFR58_07930 [Phycisphaerae bacterium]|nr:hypothetical protein [Phycisphaerales bacterium]